jgi:polar amino acid transport system permease protein
MKGPEVADQAAGIRHSARFDVLAPFGLQVGLRSCRLRLLHLLTLVGAFLLIVIPSQSAVGPTDPGIIETLLKWTQYLASGFIWNLVISALAMLIGTPLGFLVGVGLVSQRGFLLAPIWIFTQILRNSPWLVLLFYCMYLLPFRIEVFGSEIPFPDWMKATIGFALPVTAYFAEIVRGALQSIPRAQWESGEALGFTYRQTIWMIIVPQCLKRILPPWMNLYAFVTISSVLVNIVGVTDVLTATREALSAEGRSELLLPMYGYVLLWFFIYSYPIAKFTEFLERKWSVNQ